MRNAVRVLMMFLLLVSLMPLGHAVESGPLLTPPESCNHAWDVMTTTITHSNGEMVTVSSKTKEVVVDFGDYHEVFYYMMNECTLCGVQQELPVRVQQAHCYVVTEWHMDEANADAVHVTYHCDACAHIRTELLSIAAIQHADGTAAPVNCMQGAACPERTHYDDADFWYFSMPDGGLYNLVRVLLEEEGQQVTRLAGRRHCVFCGRPQMCLVDVEVSNEIYDSMPEFTYEQFMSYDADPQAPYQLIDMLRTMSTAP